MTLIRSRSLFDHGEDESVSAPLRTFIRNSDDSRLNSRSPSYNIQRRSSRRSAYSFRVHSSSHDDANKNEVGVLSVESHDLSNPSGSKFSSSQNGRVWSRGDSFIRELNMERRQGVHVNSRSASPTGYYERELEDEERTIRVTNSGKKSQGSLARSRPRLNLKDDEDAEPLSIPAMKCGPKLEKLPTLIRTPKVHEKESVLVTPALSHSDADVPSESEAYFSIEVQFNEKKKRGISQFKSILANEILKNRTISRGRSQEVRDDGRDITPQRLFSASQSAKAINRTPNSKLGESLVNSFNLSRDKKGVPASQTENTNVHGMTPGHMKRLAIKLADLRRGKSRPRSDSTDVTVVENSPRTVVDAPTNVIIDEEPSTVVFHEKPTGQFCGMGMCFTQLGEFFVGDSFGEEHQYHETGSGFSETHV